MCDFICVSKAVHNKHEPGVAVLSQWAACSAAVVSAHCRAEQLWAACSAAVAVASSTLLSPCSQHSQSTYCDVVKKQMLVVVDRGWIVVGSWMDLDGILVDLDGILIGS